MSSVSGLASYPRNAKGHELKGAVDTRQTNLQQFRNNSGAGTETPLASRQSPPGEQGKTVRGAEGDRRKVCQRFIRQPVLVELRSGINRRSRNLREGDIVEHISVNV
ncbi:MAG: hypothetical protein Q7T25_02885 [Sideroxyarcus sp.]|nr:hypothetical protein [Sideroxyarcus sp.]